MYEKREILISWYLNRTYKTYTFTWEQLIKFDLTIVILFYFTFQQKLRILKPSNNELKKCICHFLVFRQEGANFYVLESRSSQSLAYVSKKDNSRFIINPFSFNFGAGHI